MPITSCLNDECGKSIDLDGFGEHGKPTLFYCECGKVYDLGGPFQLVEVPEGQVDLSNLEAQYPISKEHYGSDVMSRGLFIDKTRLSVED